MTAEYPFEFQCQRSGNCCARPGGVVLLGPGDAERIATHLGMTEEAFRSRYVVPGSDRLRDGTFGSGCVFLESGAQAGCSIYPVRPEQCRTWPFWEELKDPAEMRRAMRFCPGIRPRS